MGNNQTEKAFEKISTNNLFSRGTIKAGKRSGRQKEIRNYRSQKRCA